MRSKPIWLAVVMFVLSGMGAIAASTRNAPPVKWIKLTNNTQKIVYPIVFSGARGVDEWLQSLFQTSKARIGTDLYTSKSTYRSYVIEDNGMAPGTSLYVEVPFYSQLAVDPDPTKNDQYIDWWNGGRVLFYDDKAQIVADYTSPGQKLETPLTAGLSWCRTLNATGTACVNPRKLKVFGAVTGFPETDLSQLTEYTFADAITANGAPYPLAVDKVGYNISSVDQVYLPIAMEPLGNKTIPYIGTVLDVPTFRADINAFLTDFPGWPVYLPADPERPRVPGAYNVFASTPNLTPSGPAVEAMKSLYRQCTASPPDNTDVCTHYREVIGLLRLNYDHYATLACYDPAIKFDEFEVIKRVYGWVPFNTKRPERDAPPCPFNNLVGTVGSAKLVELENGYITHMQQSQTTPVFNPYYQLIHSKKYLDMAAYAFSIDDAVGFQSHKGTGIILTVGGSNGLDNIRKLNPLDRVTVTLGSPAKGDPKWGAFGICNGKPNYGQFENDFWSISFFPAVYPCRFTAADTAGNLFQFKINSGPQSPGGLKVSCPGDVSNPAWCASAQVVDTQQINAAKPLP